MPKLILPGQKEVQLLPHEQQVLLLTKGLQTALERVDFLEARLNEMWARFDVQKGAYEEIGAWLAALSERVKPEELREEVARQRLLLDKAFAGEADSTALEILLGVPRIERPAAPKLLEPERCETVEVDACGACGYPETAHDEEHLRELCAGFTLDNGRN